MSYATLTQHIPRLWADALFKALQASLLSHEELETWRKEHAQRLATDPDYARAWELRQAEEEAQQYWDAFYAHWFPPEEEEE